MAEMVLQAGTLPEPLLRLISTERVKVRAERGGVLLIPVEDVAEAAKTASSCPFLGVYKDGKLTVKDHIARSREDKELDF
ncbi:MAG: hypothetical protein LBE35_02165 [Clostridiales bacterium]|jgi:hypothetical protein|nr:hypothetical protein [Clostridiales bacterium]